MSTPEPCPTDSKGIGFFERYLTVWVGLCIVAGILLGKIAPGVAKSLDAMAIYVNDAPVISIPIAICLFFMMYPIMVKIDFAEVLRAGKSVRPLGLTLFINWAVKPFTMYAIASFFLGTLFLGFIGPDATDLIKMPLGVDLAVGAEYGVGTVVAFAGVKMLQVPLWRSYLAGCILLGVAPCTAMVLVWGFLAKGNDGHTLVMVAINSLVMLVLYGVLGGFLLGVGKLPVPWQSLLLSIAIYVALPLVAGYFSRRWIISAKGEAMRRGSMGRLPAMPRVRQLLQAMHGENSLRDFCCGKIESGSGRRRRATICITPNPMTATVRRIHEGRLLRYGKAVSSESRSSLVTH